MRADEGSGDHARSAEAWGKARGLWLLDQGSADKVLKAVTDRMANDVSGSFGRGEELLRGASGGVERWSTLGGDSDWA